MVQDLEKMTGQPWGKKIKKIKKFKKSSNVLKNALNK